MADYKAIDQYPDSSRAPVRKAPEKQLVKVDSYYRKPKSISDDDMAEKERQAIINRNKK